MHANTLFQAKREPGSRFPTFKHRGPTAQLTLFDATHATLRRRGRNQQGEGEDFHGSRWDDSMVLLIGGSGCWGGCKAACSTVRFCPPTHAYPTSESRRFLLVCLYFAGCMFITLFLAITHHPTASPIHPSIHFLQKMECPDPEPMVMNS